VYKKAHFKTSCKAAGIITFTLLKKLCASSA